MQKTKLCSKCKEKKPATLEYFHKQSQGVYGLHSCCKTCRNKKRKAYYHKRGGKKLSKENYNKNRTPYLVRAMQKRGYKHLTNEIYDEIIDNFKTENGKNVCPYCNREMEDEKMIHIDHFIPYADGGADIMTNLIPACKYCNRSKMNMRFSDWFRDQFFYSKQREKRVLSYFYGNKLKKYFPPSHKGTVLNNKTNETKEAFQISVL